MPYITYDFEAVYNRALTDLEEAEIRDRKLNGLYMTKTTKAGEMLEAQVFPAFTLRADYSRAKKVKQSRREQQNLNEKNSRRKFVRILNANFGPSDIWGTFGYDDGNLPPTPQAAKRDAANFISRINYRRKKRGQKPLEYMIVTEYSTDGETRVHHHIVMRGDVDRDEIEALWGKGAYPQTRRLVVKDLGLTGLATYLSKGSRGAKMWSASKGLKHPKPTESLKKFSKAEVQKMACDRNTLKAVFERKYKGYAYNEDFPAEVKYSDLAGGYYVYTRLYRKPGGVPKQRKQVKK